MRLMDLTEASAVSGGVSELETLIGVIGAVTHEGGMAGLALGAAAFAGIGVGMAINSGWQAMTGNSIGSSIYNVTHGEP